MCIKGRDIIYGQIKALIVLLLINFLDLLSQPSNSADSLLPFCTELYAYVDVFDLVDGRIEQQTFF